MDEYEINHGPKQTATAGGDMGQGYVPGTGKSIPYPTDNTNPANHPFTHIKGDVDDRVDELEKRVELNFDFITSTMAQLTRIESRIEKLECDIYGDEAMRGIEDRVKKLEGTPAK